MIVRARTLVTMEGPPIDDGAVVISANRITAVGSFNEVRQESSGDVLDLGEQVLFPGLINAHCHLDYTALRSRIQPNRSFAAWVQAINAAKAQLSLNDYLSSIHTGLDEAARFGTTSIINFEAFPRIVSRVQSQLRIWWVAELIDVRSPESPNDLINSALDALNVAPRRGLAPHSLFTASEALYKRCYDLTTAGELLLSTHLAESRDEMEMFRNGSGPLHNFLQSIGRDMSDCGNQTPLARFVDAFNQLGTANPNIDLSRWIVVHLNELSTTDFQLLLQMNSKFHIVHCPRSHHYFGHEQFQFERLRQLGFNISLGTDSLASNDDLSLFGEMRAFQQRCTAVAPRDIVEMVTLNPARALRLENHLGMIRPGAFADLVAIPHSARSDPFESIIEHHGPVVWTMAAGATVTEGT